eukprot:6205965-Pleurochrysis_carterae.AAC.4
MRTEERVECTQAYVSSAVKQLLVLVAAQEESWHRGDTFSMREKLHLQQQLSTRRLKCEMQESLGAARPSALSVLSRKAAAGA